MKLSITFTLKLQKYKQRYDLKGVQNAIKFFAIQTTENIQMKKRWQCMVNCEQCIRYLLGQELVEVALDFLSDGVPVGVKDFFIVVDDASVH